MSRDLLRAYLRGEVRALQPDDEPGAPPLAPAALARAVARAHRPVAPEVHRVLVAQNARLAPSPARDAHLEALGRGAAAVVTGQQVGLFLGPLYTLYKAASAVVLARALAERTGAPVVPVFWLQTEDHDLPEIASVAVPGRTGPTALAVPVDAANRIAIAHCALPPEIDGCLDALTDALADGRPITQTGADHVARLRRHYRPGAAWADAFAGVLGELFAPEGLVMIDPREPALARAVAPVHARALADAAPIAAALIANDAELVGAGFKPAVHVRPGAPLAFFHPDGAHGPRVRLEPAPGGDPDRFVECGRPQIHSRDELAAALAADPMRFSTSALLRPIVQDTLLPTAAYVGGPAEVAYFAQLPPVYRAFDRALPLVVPRARFRIVDERARRLLDRLGLAVGDAERPEAELLARLRGPGAGGGADVSARLLAPFTAAHGELAAKLGDAGPEIARALARTRGTVERALGKLAAKLERAALYQDAALVDAVRRLRALLAPGGAPQERVHGLAGFAARAPDRAIVERVLATIDPSDPTQWPTLKELA
ncbi:MAG TPA: bacillithiol biosynthesis cysteine-adding enzyme BshC [Kofleriaceae bacterium]|nr:bacillithiol biosynthesis cysteine-adding enzyme BshC [Kofleriaceae bacterium]